MDTHIPVEKMNFTQEQARYMYKVLHELTALESMRYLLEGVIHTVDAMQLATANSTNDDTIVTPIDRLNFVFAARNGDYRHGANELYKTHCGYEIDGTYQAVSLPHIKPCPDCIEALETKDSTTEYTVGVNRTGLGFRIYRPDGTWSGIFVPTGADADMQCANINAETRLLREQLASAQNELDQMRQAYARLDDDYFARGKYIAELQRQLIKVKAELEHPIFVCNEKLQRALALLRDVESNT